MTLDQLIDPLKDRLQILERKGDLRVPIADVTADASRVWPKAAARSARRRNWTCAWKGAMRSWCATIWPTSSDRSRC